MNTRSQQSFYIVKIVTRTRTLGMNNLAGNHDKQRYQSSWEWTPLCFFNISWASERLNASNALNIYESHAIVKSFSDQTISRLSVGHHLSIYFFFFSSLLIFYPHTCRSLAKKCEVTLNQLSGPNVKVKWDLCVKSLAEDTDWCSK